MVQGILYPVVFAHFKVQMRPSDPSCLSHLSDALAALHELALFDEIGSMMGIDRGIAVGVPEDNRFTVAAEGPTKEDVSRRSGQNRSADWSRNVNPVVEPPVPWAKAGGNPPMARPRKTSAPVGRQRTDGRSSVPVGSAYGHRLRLCSPLPRPLPPPAGPSSVWNAQALSHCYTIWIVDVIEPGDLLVGHPIAVTNLRQGVPGAHVIGKMGKPLGTTCEAPIHRKADE